MKKILMAQLTGGEPAAPVPALAVPSTALTTATTPSAPLTDAEATEGIGWCEAQSPARPTGANTGRNNWVFEMARFCNKRGIPQASLLAHALARWQEPDFDATEIATAIAGVYRREMAAHNCEPFVPAARFRPARRAAMPAPDGTGAATAQRPGEATPLPALETDGNTTSDGSPEGFPAKVFSQLPDFLRQGCQPFTGREADMLLLGLLTACSAVLPQVTGIYDGKRVGANLYAFVVAPPASGKAVLTWAEKVVRPRHMQLVEASRQQQAQYEMELAEQPGGKRGRGKAAALRPPARRQLLMPANASFAALVQALADNEGAGLIFETEADTLAGILKNNDWGGYSPLLRAGFHHEAYRTLRKGDGAVEIARPQLSVMLTGTPNQVQNLIQSVEDGLCSRFLFYMFEGKVAWRDTFAMREPLDDYYAARGQQLITMITALTQPVTVQLTPAQAQQHRARFEQWTAEVPVAHGEEHSSLRRLGLSAFRLAMLFTVLRSFEDGVVLTGTVTCADQDFELAMTLIGVLHQHTIYVLASLRQVARPAGGRGRAKQAIGDEHRAQILTLAQQGLSTRQIEQQLGVSKSTVHRLLTEDEQDHPAAA